MNTLRDWSLYTDHTCVSHTMHSNIWITWEKQIWNTFGSLLDACHKIGLLWLHFFLVTQTTNSQLLLAFSSSFGINVFSMCYVNFRWYIVRMCIIDIIVIDLYHIFAFMSVYITNTCNDRVNMLFCLVVLVLYLSDLSIYFLIDSSLIILPSWLSFIYQFLS